MTFSMLHAANKFDVASNEYMPTYAGSSVYFVILFFIEMIKFILKTLEVLNSNGIFSMPRNAVASFSTFSYDTEFRINKTAAVAWREKSLDTTKKVMKLEQIAQLAYTRHYSVCVRH